MAEFKLTKWDRTFLVDDGAKRGPMTMAMVVFHPTERRLIAACADRRLALWDLDAQKQKLKKGEFVEGRFVCSHEGGWIRSCDIHRSGEWLVTGGSDRRLKLWSWKDGQPAENASYDIAAHDGWVEAVRFSPNGKLLATVGADRLVRIWDAATLQAVKSLSGHSNYPRDVGWSPDGKRLVSGAEDGKLLVWDATNWDLQRTIDFGDANEQFGQDPSLSGVHRLSISRDNRWVAAAGGKRTALFDLETGEMVAGAKVEVQVAFSPTADLLIAGSNVSKVLEYDTDKLVPPPKDKKGNQPRPEIIPGREVTSIKLGDFSLGIGLSRDGSLIGFGKTDGTVEVWEVAS